MIDGQLQEIKSTHEKCPWMVYREWEEIGGYVTADMASDACEPSMEGMPIPETRGEWVPYEGTDELIAALETAQAELTEALKYRDINLSNFQKENKLNANLRKQLAEVQAEVKRLEALPHDEIILLEDKEDVE